ncbi:MAG: hypothetical protein E7515_07020 [Ruminococcaceae bacterium]|nr:hypothetical protein [Oscillospiraceae bacterium]
MKKSVRKKYLAVLLSLVLLISVMPINAFSVSDGAELVSVEVENFDVVYLGDGYEVDPIWFGETGEKYFRYNFEPQNVTAHFSDGSVVTGYPYEIGDQIDIYPQYSQDQSSDNQWGLGAHSVTISYGDISTTYTVTVIESPIQSISVAPVTLTENSLEDGWDDSDENGEFFRYQPSPDGITITYKNGETIYYAAEEYYEQVGYYAKLTDDQSYLNQWGVGAHTATLSITGVECQFTVNIVASPVESIVANSSISLAENYDGYMSGYYDEESDQWIENAYFRYDFNTDEVSFTVTYNNGDVFVGTADEIQEQTGSEVYIRDSQSYATPWTVGENQLPFNFCGKTGYITVNVIECPVDRIEIGEISVTEGDSSRASKSVYRNGQWVYYPDYAFPTDITIYYKDGSVIHGDSPWDIEDQTGYDFEIESDNSYDNQWTPGVHTATARFYGKSVEYSVTVLESPIVSVSAQDIEIEQYSHGGWSEEYDSDGNPTGERYFHYYIDPVITITLNDGRQITGNRDYIYDEFGFDVRIDSNQSQESPWDIGEYEATVSVLGKSASVTVTIVESSVLSISIDDMEYTEGVCGNVTSYYDENDVYHEILNYQEPDHIVITYKDGSVIEGYSTYDIYEQTGTWVNLVCDNTFETPWSVGVHTVTAQFGGVECTYTVTINESPVESFSIEDITVEEFTNGNWSSVYNEDSELIASYFNYSLNEATATVHLKDGTVLTGTTNEIEQQLGPSFSFSYSQDFEHPWGVGSHEVTARFSGLTATFNVTITESPIDSISVENMSFVVGTHGYRENEYTDGEFIGSYYRYNVDPQEITVNFKDGRTFTGPAYEFNDTYGYNFDFYYITDQSYDNQWGVGDHEFTVGLGGFRCNCTLTLTESPVESFTVEPMDVIYGTNGYNDTRWNAETGEYEEFYHYNIYIDNITVNFKNGETFTGTAYDFQNTYGYDVSWGDPQYNASFEIGQNIIDVSICGVAGQFIVNILESPIESFTIEPVTYTEGTNCYQDSYWDENSQTEIPFYHYYIDYENITVNFKNGETFTGSVYDFQDTYGYSVEIKDTQSGSPFTVGQNELETSICGTAGVFIINITESPIESITIEPVSYIVETNGYWDSYWNYDTEQQERYYRYNTSIDNLTVNFKDGTSFTGSVDEFSDTYGYYADYSDNQANEHFTVGQHVIDVTIGGRSAQFIINILESPIESFTVEPQTIVLETEGYWDSRWNDDTQQDEEFYHYNVYIENLTVNFKDGTTFTGTIYDFRNQYYEVNWYDPQYETPLTLGSNPIDVSIAGCQGQFVVNIVETPIESFTLSPYTCIFETDGYLNTRWNEATGEYEEFFCYNYEPTNISVNFKDGTSFTGTVSEFEDTYGYSINWSDPQYDTPFTLGENTLEVELRGCKGEMTVNVIETVIDSVTININPMIEGSSDYGYPQTDWDYENNCPGKTYFYYWVNIESMTVNFTNGEVFTGTPDEFASQYGYTLEYNNNQSYENRLTVGDNFIPFRLMGYSGSFNVKIIPSPIQIVNGEIVTTMAGTKLKFFTNNWYSVSDGEPLGTNYFVQCVTDDENETVIDEMNIVLYGDLSSSDTYVNDSDINEAFEHLMTGWTYDGVLAEASDVNHDGVFDAFDISLIDLISAGKREKEYGLSRGW